MFLDVWTTFCYNSLTQRISLPARRRSPRQVANDPPPVMVGVSSIIMYEILEATNGPH
jgi:hypothetical protein